MSYVASRNVNIDGKVFEAGEVITGVSEARCQHLLGRFIVASDDSAQAGNKPVEAVVEDDDSLESMTNAQLKKMAEELGINVPSGANKATIIKAIEEAAE